MGRYRKLSVEIEAEQFTRDHIEAYFFDAAPLPRGVRLRRGSYNLEHRTIDWSETVFAVRTIHGEWATIVAGDWIMPEPDGEHFYPCKPDIFAATYEPADAPPSPSEAQQERRDDYRAGWFDALRFLREKSDAMDVLDSRSMVEYCYECADGYLAALASVPPSLAPACAQCGNALAMNGACYRCQPITFPTAEAPAHAD